MAEFVAATATVRPAVGNQDQLRRLYWAYFNRGPDAAGLVYWMAEVQRSGLDAASAAFALTPEFATTYGQLDDGQFVNLVYWNVLTEAPMPPARRTGSANSPPAGTVARS